ncbi:DUF397 domain-containing protein [Streptomyces sp. QTS137]
MAQCVEVARSDACPTVPVRDSKTPTGPVVTMARTPGQPL